MRALRALGEAFGYFSVLPAGRFAGNPVLDPNALAMLPLVGVVLGAIAGALGFAAYLWLHASWAFVVAWAASIVLTGAIHVDGFLDSCDALFATVTPQRRLEILKDPRHGTFAVAGMAMLAAFWLGALVAIAPPRYPLAIAFSAAAARLVVAPVAWVFRYAHPSAVLYTIAFAIVEAMAWFVSPWALAAAPLAVAAALLFGWW
ncbi:MAG: adenosylcobinamide-GDP ribazoletransferase, partial [Candidatus Baltobacteraceae bacterium]